MCYDHLAGRLGVRLLDELERSQLLVPDDGGYAMTGCGETALSSFGLDIPALRKQRRLFIRACLDRSEHRFHLAGALGRR
jgi:hypothetical protein